MAITCIDTSFTMEPYAQDETFSGRTKLITFLTIVFMIWTSINRNNDPYVYKWTDIVVYVMVMLQMVLCSLALV